MFDPNIRLLIFAHPLWRLPGIPEKRAIPFWDFHFEHTAQTDLQGTCGGVTHCRFLHTPFKGGGPFDTPKQRGGNQRAPASQNNNAVNGEPLNKKAACGPNCQAPLPPKKAFVRTARLSRTRNRSLCRGFASRIERPGRRAEQVHLGLRWASRGPGETWRAFEARRFGRENTKMAVGQHQWDPIWGRCRFPFWNLRGNDWDVRWGYDLGLDP